MDGPCGCAEGETPLFAAVTHGRAAVTRRLLAARADPSAANRAGVRPLDVARARGREDLVQALLQAGAEPGVRLSAWPEVRPLDDAGWVDTGIRGLDLLAPLRLGMRVRVHGAAETGLFALITELTFGLARRGLAPVWASLERRPWQRGELATVAAGAGLDEVEVVSDGVEAAVERARGRALFVFAEEGREAEVEARLGILSRAGLAFVVDPWAAVTRGDKGAPTLGAPWDAVVVTDPALANAGVYPALDLARTGSTAVRSASQADLRDKLVAMGAEAPAVQAFLRQPFFTYQHHNAWPGEASSWAQTEAAARAAVGVGRQAQARGRSWSVMLL
ncbi:MAG: ankyrin repeat domain-containing protein [Deltaproteobacteria bacterium]|nr:ankyrin repeat domain-containing protein [Deltaproteobacteria bacterium]